MSLNDDKLSILAATFACDYRDDIKTNQGVPDNYIIYSAAYDGFLAGYAAREERQQEIEAEYKKVEQKFQQICKQYEEAKAAWSKQKEEE